MARGRPITRRGRPSRKRYLSESLHELLNTEKEHDDKENSVLYKKPRGRPRRKIMTYPHRLMEDNQNNTDIQVDSSKLSSQIDIESLGSDDSIFTRVVANIFVHPNGRPFVFYVARGRGRGRIMRLIERLGGIITVDEDDEDLDFKIGFHDRYPPLEDGWISDNFVKMCYHDKKLHPLQNFKLTPTLKENVASGINELTKIKLKKCLWDNMVNSKYITSKLYIQFAEDHSIDSWQSLRKYAQSYLIPELQQKRREGQAPDFSLLNEQETGQKEIVTHKEQSYHDEELSCQPSEDDMHVASQKTTCLSSTSMLTYLDDYSSEEDFLEILTNASELDIDGSESKEFQSQSHPYVIDAKESVDNPILKSTPDSSSNSLSKFAFDARGTLAHIESNSPAKLTDRSNESATNVDVLPTLKEEDSADAIEDRFIEMLDSFAQPSQSTQVVNELMEYSCERTKTEKNRFSSLEREQESAVENSESESAECRDPKALFELVHGSSLGESEHIQTTEDHQGTKDIDVIPTNQVESEQENQTLQNELTEKDISDNSENLEKGVTNLSVRGSEKQVATETAIRTMQCIDEHSSKEPTDRQKLIFKSLFEELCKRHPHLCKQQVIAALDLSGGYFSLAERLLVQNMNVNDLNDNDRKQLFLVSQDLLIIKKNNLEEIETLKGEDNVKRRKLYLLGRERLSTERVCPIGL